jgi:1-acyl-sn-glycerol-3-phosphate acyltransferase
MPGWSVHIEGREKIRKDATYVVVSNHQSMVDILAGYRLFFHFKWIAKAELFRVPFIGWNMSLNRYVYVKRGDRRSIIEMLKASEKHLRNDSSVFIFPEGTRSETGVMGDFKLGAFSLAKRVHVPILPIAITGTRDALPKGSIILRGRHRIGITVLDEIPAETAEVLEAGELAELVRNRLLEVVEPDVSTEALPRDAA